MGVRATLAWQAGDGGDAVVRAAGVKVFGSAGALAPASLLSEALVDCTTEAATSLCAEDLLLVLGNGSPESLPTAVHRGAACAIDAVQCALGLPFHRPSDPGGRGILVCRCVGVGDQEIRRAVEHGAVTPEAVGEKCGACTGCRSCRPDLLLLVHEYVHGPVPLPRADLHPVARILLARLGPILAAQGLPLRDVEVTENQVHLRLDSPAAAASLSLRGAREAACVLLKETVGTGIEVTVEEAV
jgi:bacterioferritin-associated ferredoxin